MVSRRRKGGSGERFPLLGLQNHYRWWLQPWNQKRVASCQESNEKSRQCIEKQRHYCDNKGLYSQGYGLSSGHLWLWELDWRRQNIKEAERQRTDTFKRWCFQRLLKVPWKARRSNQSILTVINPECLLEGLMLKLKLQYFGHPLWRTDSLEKSLTLGKTEGRRRRGHQRMWWLDWITNTMNMNLGKFQEMLTETVRSGVL